ncbi:CmpA/NrtA family ABC transporter substrate-binding protein [Inquilinus sp. Marseille-Q2685]|uniref:CmpA/NrtA family ABC transporter substrate-binding protein n=1 Tax=Inquilinus sp. Marseille-Q2685 TaxID=2866581 RepID=UPI001CE4B07B|nr:CmpA/NrtA family ABC transporter substrate-binding protein [Inquilinus sp. Marseille-Q2685]
MTDHRTDLTLGFVPLADCAPLIVAERKGFFREEGLSVRLSRESSWASLRDKLVCGLLDGAHMLAPLPLAITLGLSGAKTPMLVGLSLNLNGNAVTVSNALAAEMAAADPEGAAAGSATAVAAVVAARRKAGAPPPVFAIVFPVSSHHDQLRYWLAAGGVDPQRDVRIVVVPPPQMVSHLSAGRVDGFCVGAPWGDVAVDQGVGVMATTGWRIWNNAPEKVFAVTRAWAEPRPDVHRALLRALIRAAAWLDRPQHRTQAVAMLAAPEVLNAPAASIAAGLVGRPGELMVDGLPARGPVYHRRAAGLPWRSHAAWFLAQLRRWGELPDGVDIAAAAAAVYRPDLYREAVWDLGYPAPAADSKAEGLHAAPWVLADPAGEVALGAARFCDGRVFDPAAIDSYLAGLGYAAGGNATAAAQRG